MSDKQAGNGVNDKVFIGVDVGTGSARAGIFTETGTLLASAKTDIQIFREEGAIVEQSSENIWASVCASLKQAVAQAGISAEQVAGFGFDATCSLVLVDADGNPISVSPSDDPQRNIIVWMDHRSMEQTERINGLGHRVLDYVGGRISPEMETPKLLWLKENKPDAFNRAAHFFDLTDYLTWRCTSDLARSVCTVTCKWTFMAHENAWDASYFNEAGLSELVENDFQRIGSRVVDAGVPLGQGLTEEAASDLGLLAGTPVGAGLIDAHAGGVGTIGAQGESPEIETRMGYVFGTSACTMASSQKEVFVPGVWGPYYSAMVPGYWLMEGGQSAAGEAIAHLLKLSPCYEAVRNEAEGAGQSLPNYLLELIAARGNAASDAIKLAKQIVVVPEFLGNRAPFADPESRAIVSGLDLNESVDGLIGLYVAGIVGLGYGLRQILAAQSEAGVCPSLVVMSGGAGENPIVKQLLADSARIKIAGPGTKEPVLLGSAMLGAVASGTHGSLTEAMQAMSTIGDVFEPSDGKIAVLHDLRFSVFENLQTAARTFREADWQS